MKTTLFVLLFLCATAALGQSGASSLSNEPQVFQITSHTLHASQQPMQAEKTLLSTSTFAYGRGERPLSEFPVTAATAIAPAEISLGEAARLLRGQHAVARKATKVVEQ
jgi:hypothetical protein